MIVVIRFRIVLIDSLCVDVIVPLTYPTAEPIRRGVSTNWLRVGYC